LRGLTEQPSDQVEIIPDEWGESSLTSPRRAASETKSFWVVIPARNEEARLATTIQHYLSSLRSQDRLVVVVNGSTDGTEALARDAAAGDARVRVLVETGRTGKGGAVLLGFEHVRRLGRGNDVVCFVDADCAVSGSEVVR
jgi:glycosyltransferase involved in cell wall biosynthesis